MSANVNLNSVLFDFHTHSNMSDGDCKPSNVVALAKMRNIKYLALTDHDKVTGIEEALVSANENSIKLASGCEFSTPHHKHIVGLCIDTKNEQLTKLLDYQASVVRDKITHIGKELAKLGFYNALDDVIARSIKGSTINNYCFARYLEDIGVCAKNTGYEKFFATGGLIPKFHSKWSSIEEVCEVILASGGIPILAHLWRYYLPKNCKEYEDLNVRKKTMEELVERFKAAGGIGLEVDGSRVEEWNYEFLYGLAKKYDLYVSAGSDFHNEDSPTSKNFGRKFLLPEDLIPIWHHERFKFLN